MRITLQLALAVPVILLQERQAEVRMPETVAVLMANENHPAMSPVRFTHARHVDPEVMGRDVACAECHHPLNEEPGKIPAACTSCHPFNHEVEPQDESVPHEHLEPPDL